MDHVSGDPNQTFGPSVPRVTAAAARDDDTGDRSVVYSTSSAQQQHALPSLLPSVSSSRKRIRPAASATIHTNASHNNIDIDTNDSSSIDMAESNDYYGSMQLRELLPHSQRTLDASDDVGPIAHRRAAQRTPMLRALVACGAALALLLLTTFVFSSSPPASLAPVTTTNTINAERNAPVKPAPNNRSAQLDALFESLEPFRSPRERVSTHGALRTTLHVNAVRFTNGPIAFTTRAYDQSVPGPTLRVQPGDTLEIELINDLAPDVPGDWTLNTLHNPNTTNLHVHGMHVDPTGVADNVLRVVSPGAAATTRIHIPLDHPRGLFHYHPHYHGSVFLQMGGGMAGALIVDPPDDGTDNVPSMYAALPESIVVLQEFKFAGGLGSSAVAVAQASRSRLALNLEYTTKSLLSQRVQALWPRIQQPQPPLAIPRDAALEQALNSEIHSNEDIKKTGQADDEEASLDRSTNPPISDYFTVNGQFLPRLTVTAGTNHLLRLVNAGGVSTLELSLPGCSMTLTASDGIYLQAPRMVETLVLSNGARADVVINCHAISATYEALRPLQSMQHEALDSFLGVSTDVFAGVVMFVHVVDEEEDSSSNSRKEPVPLITAIPAPSTLYDTHASLLTLSAADEAAMDASPFVFEFSMGGAPTMKDGFAYKHYTINNKTFDGVSMRSMPLGVVQEWVIVNDRLIGGAVARANHPFHMHTNAFQVVAMSHGAGVEYEVGDWRDVISVPTPGNVTIRFRPVDFTGVVLAHCHVLGHSDGGMVAAVTITP